MWPKGQGQSEPRETRIESRKYFSVLWREGESVDNYKVRSIQEGCRCFFFFRIAKFRPIEGEIMLVALRFKRKPQVVRFENISGPGKGRPCNHELQR